MSEEASGYTGPWYQMFYRHCDAEWEDTWSCACNDECPKCGAEVEPYDYQLIQETP